MTQGFNAGYAGAAMQAGSAIADFIGSIQQANAYERYQKEQINATLENNRYQLRALKNRYSEEVEALNQQQQQVYLQNLQARARAVTSAAGNGVEGGSLDALFLGYERATAVSKYMTDRELRLKGLQLQDNADALRVQASNAINSLAMNTDSAASTLLSGIGTVLTSYSELKGKESNK